MKKLLLIVFMLISGCSSINCTPADDYLFESIKANSIENVYCALSAGANTKITINGDPVAIYAIKTRNLFLRDALKKYGEFLTIEDIKQMHKDRLFLLPFLKYACLLYGNESVFYNIYLPIFLNKWNENSDLVIALNNFLTGN